MNSTSPFYSSEQYPELRLLEENWSVIDSEIPPFDRKAVKIERDPNAFAN